MKSRNELGSEPEALFGPSGRGDGGGLSPGEERIEAFSLLVTFFLLHDCWISKGMVD